MKTMHLLSVHLLTVHLLTVYIAVLMLLPMAHAAAHETSGMVHSHELPLTSLHDVTLSSLVMVAIAFACFCTIIKFSRRLSSRTNE